MDNRKKVVIGISAVLAIVVVVIGVFLINKNMKDSKSLGEMTTITSDSVNDSNVAPDITTPTGGGFEQMADGSIYYGDSHYELRSGVTTMLLMGVDKTATCEMDGYEGDTGVIRSMLLFIMDSNDNTCKILEINTDTLTSVSAYDATRNVVATEELPIGLQYAFGENDAHSCYLMKTKVRLFLQYVPVNYYCVINNDAITTLVDHMGSLNVAIDEDMTWLNSEFTSGTTINMTATEAATYFISSERNTSDSLGASSWLLEKVYSSLSSISRDEAEQIYNELGNNFLTDMDVDTMREFHSYSVNNYYYVPGEYSEEGFVIDESTFNDIIIELFYCEV